MPRIELLREQLRVARMRVKKMSRELGEARQVEARKRQQLDAALERRTARLVDAALRGGR